MCVRFDDLCRWHLARPATRVRPPGTRPPVRTVPARRSQHKRYCTGRLRLQPTLPGITDDNSNGATTAAAAAATEAAAAAAAADAEAADRLIQKRDASIETTSYKGAVAVYKATPSGQRHTDVMTAVSQ